MPGTIVAVKLDKVSFTGRITEITAEGCGIRRIDGKSIMLTNWAKAYLSGRMIMHRDVKVLESSKTVIVSKPCNRPGILQKIIACFTGWRFKKSFIHRKVQLYSGQPHIIPGWCCRKKFKGTLYEDGFFIPRWPRSGYALYYDHHNRLKALIWRKKQSTR
ncbi:MAG TPA: hypothetical protein VFV08_15470 [Puia sp.]|nr:hypothetical protein [Puia sp.]